MAHVLIATLGDSPIVITGMYDLLTRQKGLAIDQVIVLHPGGENRRSGYEMIKGALSTELCSVGHYLLPFEDAYDEQSCVDFLRYLYLILEGCQQRGDDVSLSLAGGRKNMSAIMAFIAPLFHDCLQGLYHVIDKNEFTTKTSFKSLEDLEDLYTGDTTRYQAAMHPDLAGLVLVPIPFKDAPGISKTYLQQLLTTTDEEYNELDENDGQKLLLDIAKPELKETLLQVFLTERAKKDFEKLGGGSRERNFIKCFEGMRSPTYLVRQLHSLIDRKAYPVHFYKGGDSAERPLFHTEPGDILNYPRSDVQKVVVERLAKHRNKEEYEPEVKQLARTIYNGNEQLISLDKILDTSRTREHTAEGKIPSILIVPMGAVPMVATQLYTLLSERERRAIREVILLYPASAENGRVVNAAKMAKSAFDYEKVTCTEEAISGLADIASEEDCRTYQGALEQSIQDARRRYPNCRIDLALSGGRKGMAAMALFAAQRTQLREVYHTLIADPDLDWEIQARTDSQKLKDLPRKERNDRLFLREYVEHKAAFRLFKVPMGPLHGK